MRYRQQEEFQPSYIYLGRMSYDTRAPYGDGPWQNLSAKTLTCSPDTVHTKWKKCWDELHPGPPWRTGGPLDIWDLECNRHEVKSVQTLYAGRYRYVGGFCCEHNPLNWTDYLSSTFGEDDWGDISDYGAEAWNRFRPGQSYADAAQFIAELSEVPRMLMQTALGFRNLWKSMGGSPTGFGPRSVADHWLNTQFGWLPFLNDLRKFYNLTQHLDQRIAQLRRDNGQWKKVGGSVRSESDSEEVASSSYATAHRPTLYGYFYADSPNTGSYSVTRTDSREVWFRGRMKYYLPSIETCNKHWRQNAINHLFGIKPSPSVLWEITPWSWLIDWGSNVGDVIANMTASVMDQLVAKYAYIMGTTTQKVTIASTADFISGSQDEEWTGSFTRKMRTPANPFGFGLTGLDLSARQMSILVALGLSKSRGLSRTM